jgi:hypothetical protein
MEAPLRSPGFNPQSFVPEKEQAFMLIVLSHLPFAAPDTLTLEQNKISFALSPFNCMDRNEKDSNNKLNASFYRTI